MNMQNRAATKSRYDILKEIREQFGPDAARTTRFIDALIAAWDTIDLLTEVLSAEQAQEYIQAGFDQEAGTDEPYE